MSFFGFGSKRKREAAKARANLWAEITRARAFNASMVDRIVGQWKWDGGFSNSEVLGSLATIRSRSRDMAKNSPLYSRFISLFRENVVGDGFRLKAMPFADAQHPEAIDRDAARFVEYHFWRWANDPACADVGGQMSLVQLLTLAAENWARDGEAFLVIDRDAQNRYGLALRIIRPECVDETYHATSGDGKVMVRGGVEVDVETARPLAYFVDPGRTDTFCAYSGKSVRVRVPASDVIHVFERHDAEQVRGVPVGYSALLPLKMLEEYNRAELVAARDEASTIGFFTSSTGTEGAAEMDANTAGAMKNAVEAGDKMILPSGWTYSSNTPQHPNREWGAYNVALQRLISTGLGVDFAELTGNGSDTISAVARQSMLRTREMWKDRQRTMIATALDRIFAEWLRAFLASGNAAPFADADFDRLSDHAFQGRRWGWIDPTAEVNAAVVAVAHGWRTDAEIAAEYGNDIDDDIAEAARVKPAKAAAGLLVDGNGLNPVQQPQASPEQEQERPAGEEAAKPTRSRAKKEAKK